MQLSKQTLNRTLLARQHLLERTTSLEVPDLVRHLIGLQAQENLPPYLSLAARLEDFDPTVITDGLNDRSLVRLLTMRGTIHLLVADDALMLRQWTQPCQDREKKSSQNTKPALHLDTDEFKAAVATVLADGPLPIRRLNEGLAEHFPGVPPAALGQLARVNLPLAQLPPRGAWKASGGVAYDYVDRWVGRSLIDPDTEEIIRRYLRAFGPATAADVTAWSGITRLGPVVKAMEDLVEHTDEKGRVLYDVPEGEIVDGDTPAPVRLFGTYDNVWLSHAARDRVTHPQKRTQWMGANGGVGMTLLLDGWLEGLWRIEEGRPTVMGLFRDLTKREKLQLDEEFARVEAMLAR